MSIVRFAMAALLTAAFVTPAAAGVKNPEKMVCKSETKAGTRIPERTCMTAGEWDALSESAKRSAADTLRGGRPWQGDSDTMKPGQAPGSPY
jgi:hypothetical protein